jgi:AcrR family transcriptional regulator
VGKAQLSLRERKKIETRNRILDVAVQLFQDQGFGETPIDQVAAEANVSRATVFNYFPSKQDLLRAIAESEYSHLAHMSDSAFAEDSSTVYKIRAVMRQLVADTAPYLEVARYVILDAILSPGAGGSDIGLSTVLLRLVREAQQNGEIRAGLDPEDVVRAITGAYLSVFFAQDAGASPLDGSSVSRIVDMLFEGIAGPALTPTSR